MPSEPQRKLKSFLRNNLTFNMMKHSTTANSTSSNHAPPKTASGKTATEAQTLAQLETEVKTFHQEDNRRSIGSGVPNSAYPSSPSTHPRVSTSSLSPEHGIMASPRQVKRSREKSVSDDHRSQSHTLRRHAHGLSVNDATTDNDKNKQFADLSGTDVPFEFERLKKEIEGLKKTVQEQKKIVRKQLKKNEDLKTEVAVNIVALVERDLELTAKDDELRKVKDNFGKMEDCISSLETVLQCQVCIELLHRPYALSPCGHVFCLVCLQEWFRKAPAGDYDDIEDPDDPRYILRRPKSCPCCRTRIVHRPIPLFVLRAATNALATSRPQPLGMSGRADSPLTDNDGDPWKGIFPTSEDDEESASDVDDNSSVVDSLAESDDRMSDRFTHYSDDLGPYGFESGSESESASVAPYGIHGSEEENIYVHPRWQPASRFAGFYRGVDDGSEEDATRAVSLLRRGCPFQMIISFHMTYTRQYGIIAYVPSLDPTRFLDDRNTEIEMMHRIFLGWNIDVDEETDNHGCAYMQQILTELMECPEKWEIRARVGVPRNDGVFDATHLVRLSEMEEYDSDLVSYLEGVELD